MYGLFFRQIDKEIAACQREMMETHYQEVETMYRQMRGWRHDYRSHIQALKALAAEGHWPCQTGLDQSASVDRRRRGICPHSPGLHHHPE